MTLGPLVPARPCRERWAGELWAGPPGLRALGGQETGWFDQRALDSALQVRLA